MQKFGYKHMSFILLFTSYNSFEAGLTSINKLYKGKPVVTLYNKRIWRNWQT